MDDSADAGLFDERLAVELADGGFAAVRLEAEAPRLFAGLEDRDDVDGCGVGMFSMVVPPWLVTGRWPEPWGPTSYDASPGTMVQLPFIWSHPTQQGLATSSFPWRSS